MKVRAKRQGWFGTHREVGAEFEIPGPGSLGRWMEVVDDQPPPTEDEQKRRGRQPKPKDEQGA